MSAYSLHRPAATVKSGNSSAAARMQSPYDVQHVEWSNLESRFDNLLSLLSKPVSGVNAMAMQATNQQRVVSAIEAMLDKAQAESRELLLDGDAVAAEKTGMTVLQLRERFYKPNNIALIPSYLHLARTKQFLERYGEAEDMLSLAQYILLKNPGKKLLVVKADIHQAFGLLYATDEKLEVAVQQLSRACYYLSLAHGPQHVLTTFGYFDLGNVFAAKASMESAMAMYDAVKEIWYTHLVVVLTDVVERRAALGDALKYREGKSEQEVRQSCYVTAHEFGKESMADVSKMLYGICRIQEERFQQSHPGPTRAQFVLGLFLLWADDVEEAQRYLSAAHTASQTFYGVKHPVIEEIEDWCRKFDVDLATPAGEEIEDTDNALHEAETPVEDQEGMDVLPTD